MGNQLYIVDKLAKEILPDLSGYNEESLLTVIHNNTHKRITYAVAHIEPIGYHSKISPILECEPETAASFKSKCIMIKMMNQFCILSITLELISLASTY